MSNKAKALRFSLWVTCSRKEDSLPNELPDPDSSRESQITATDHSLLPEALLGNSCAACGKEGATMRCTRYIIRNGENNSYETFRTVYCNRQCQVGHWPKHKAECAQISHLNRIVKLYDDVHEHCIDLTTDYGNLVLRKTTVKDGVLIASFENSESQRCHRDRQAKTRAALAACTPGEALAIKMLSRCNRVFEEEKSLYELLIRPICSNLEQVRFRPKNINTTVCHMAPSRVEFSGQAGHDVMLLTLSSGRRIVFDPTRAQFGWKEALSPWESYYKHRISTTNAEPPDYYCDLPREVPGQIFQNRWQGDLDNAHLVLPEVVTQKVASLLSQRYGRVESALKFGGNEFLRLRPALAASLKRGLTFVTTEMDSSTSDNLLMGSRGPGPLVGDDEFCQTATMIWVQRAKYDLDKMTGPLGTGRDNMARLLKHWEERFDPVVKMRL